MPEYINFVNEIQLALFNGTTIKNKHVFKKELIIKTSSQNNSFDKKYRVFARPLKSEEHFDLNDFGKINYSRKADEMNFLIFLIEDISLSEDVFSKAADFYVDEVSYLFKWAILTVTAILIFLVTFSILNIIKFLVIHPVELLTAHIQK